MSATHVNEYRHANGDTLGVEAGSELDKVLAKDEAYELVGKGSPAPASEASTEETETEEGGDQDTPAEEVDLKSLSREELNNLAEDKGVENPGDLPNKGEVMAAIEKASEASTEEG